MKILVIDVGGTHIKVLLSGEQEPRKFASGPAMNGTPPAYRYEVYQSKGLVVAAVSAQLG